MASVWLFLELKLSKELLLSSSSFVSSFYSIFIVSKQSLSQKLIVPISIFYKPMNLPNFPINSAILPKPKSLLITY